MAEYIEREAVEKFIVGGLNNSDVYERFGHDAIKIITEVHYMPAADVAPVVHGQWDDIPNEYMSVVSKTGTYHGNATTCSVCHDVNPNAFKTNYCPCCGAKMDGGDSDG